MWHKKESLRYTKEFGKFACQVTSKILGIGTAERSWEDVKHLKTNKRAHLLGERAKKQATIFGASCIEDTLLVRQKGDDDVTSSPKKLCRDDDLDYESNDEVQQIWRQPTRILKHTTKIGRRMLFEQEILSMKQNCK